MLDDLTTPNPVPEHDSPPTDNARQDLDDLTVLNDVQRPALGETRLTTSRSAEIDDAKLGALTMVHQGSWSAPQLAESHLAGVVPSHAEIGIEVAAGRQGTIPDIETIQVHNEAGGLAVEQLAATGIGIAAPAAAEEAVPLS